jgi:3-deoxy-D-manno-octulosonic-acid transferase
VRADLERALQDVTARADRLVGAIYPLYTLAFAAAVTGYAPVAVLRQIVRAFRSTCASAWASRAPAAAGPVRWIHAVSVGEAIAAAPLLEGCGGAGPRCRSSCPR